MDFPCGIMRLFGMAVGLVMQKLLPMVSFGSAGWFMTVERDKSGQLIFSE